MSMVLAVIVWTLIGAFTAYVAKQQGRDPIIWFFIGIILGVFAILTLLVLPAPEGSQSNNQDRERTASLPEVIPPIIEDLPVRDWFYVDKEGKQQGPIDEEAAKKLWDTHVINNQTFIWCEGMDTWKRVEEVPEFLDRIKPEQGHPH